MKNMKTRLSAAFLALVMCFGLLVGCGDSGLTVADVEKDPYAAVMDGNQKFMDALASKYGDVFGVFEKLAAGTGTYEAKVTVPETGDTGISAVVDAKNAAYSGKATVSMDGGSMDVSLWGDKSNIAVSAPFIFGDGSYGVKFDTIETDLANSELFASLTGGMTLDDIKASLESEMGIKWDDIKGVLSVDAWKTAIEKYIADAEALMKDKEYTVAEETLKIGETDVPVISVQYTQTVEDSKKAADLTFDMIESMLGGIFATAGVDFKELMTEALVAEAGTDELYTDITEKDYLDKKTGAIVASDVNYGDALKASVVFGEDVSKKFEMTMDITMTVDGETADIDLTVKEITEKGKGGFDIDATVKAAGEENTVSFDIVRNDADGKFEAKAVVGGEEMGSIAGALTYSADEFKLAIDSVTVDGENTPVGLILSAKAGGTVEAVPEYTNILTASAEELDGLMAMIESLMFASDYGYEDILSNDFEGINDGTRSDEITFEDLCEGMTEEEIDQVLQDLEDLGMTPQDLVDMLY